jgi:capsular exopolysaccharide synthesis family protein
MVAPDEQAELELGDYVEILRRRWALVVLAVVVVCGVAILATSTQSPQYRAEARVSITAPTAASTLGLSSAGLVRSLSAELRLASLPTGLDAVRDRVGSEPDLSVRSEGVDTLVFVVVSSDPDLAAFAADEHATEFLVQRREQIVDELTESAVFVEGRLAEIAMQIDVSGSDTALEAQRDRLTAQLDDLLFAVELAETDRSTVVEPSRVPSAPFAPTTSRNVAAAVVVGLMLGTGAVLVLEYLDPFVRSRRDLERSTSGLPVLAVATTSVASTPIATHADPQSSDAEAYRRLRTSVRLGASDSALGTVGITSAGSDESTAVVAANLAVACARAGSRVVLVDCQLRDPMLHELFGVPNHAGFTKVLLGEASLESAAHRLDDEPGLVLITAGAEPSDPSELLAGKRARSLVSAVADQADLVIIHTPGVASSTDPLVLAGMVDGLILVAEIGHTDQNELARSVAELRQVGGPLLGTVLVQNRSRAKKRTPTSVSAGPDAGPVRTRTESASPDWGVLPGSQPSASPTRMD